MRRRSGFSLVELLVVLSVVSLLMALVLPAMAGARRAAMGTENANNLRSIQAGLVTFAHGNGGWFPGMDSSGKRVTSSTSARYEMLLNGRYTNGQTLLSPLETAPRSLWQSGSAVNSFSYAMVSTWDATLFSSYYNSYYTSQARNESWRDTAGSESVVMADRAIRNWSNSWNPRYIRSLHVEAQLNVNDWAGHVVWGDNHVTWESDMKVDNRYRGVLTRNDDLFQSRTDSIYRQVNGSTIVIYPNEDDVYLTTGDQWGSVSLD